MYDMFYPDIVSDDEMKEIMEKGTRVTVKNKQTEVTSYLYNNKIYVYDVKNLKG